MREALTGLLPGIRVRSWHTRRCADAYTAHRHPYIDILEPGRLTIALGGNGRGAQAADAVGQLTADLALTGQWQSGLPRDAFRHVPGRRPLERHDLAPRPGQIRQVRRRGGLSALAQGSNLAICRVNRLNACSHWLPLTEASLAGADFALRLPLRSRADRTSINTAGMTLTCKASHPHSPTCVKCH